MNILVTGGAGYIGSHVVLLLSQQGFTPIIYDNLSKGHRRAVLAGKLICGDLADLELLKRVLEEEKIGLVMHFAASSLVGESVANPSLYFNNNIANTLKLLDAMKETGVNKLVFSSTAATYGEPAKIPIEEDQPTVPTNPYGFSKLTMEGIMKWYDQAYGIKFIALRYFNAAGADPEGKIGEDHNPETHLIPVIMKVALGQLPALSLFGTDYPTKDGTCIRDYIHVMDLADAHILALKALADGCPSNIYNLGNGQGFSNKEIIETARKVTGREIPVVESPRRPGDPAVLIAGSAKIRTELGWRPRYEDLNEIIATAWQWHKTHPNGFEN